jgi:hypothetical protein
MWMSYKQQYESENKEMTDSWQSYRCGRHYTGTGNKIELERKFRNGPPVKYVLNQDIRADYELYDKKCSNSVYETVTLEA